MKTNAKRAFTLLEMVVVLALLALVTHLTVREVTHLKKAGLRKVADKQLATMRDAILGTDDERDVSGQRIRTGFLSDLGRLPRLVYTNDVLTLNELWTKPPDVAAFSTRQALAANLVDAQADDADAEVYVPCGWRGPYISLPGGAGERLRDAWGNLFEAPDDTGSNRRFDTDSTNAVVHYEGNTVVALRHLGADGVYDSIRAPETDDDADYTVRLDAATNAQLTVYMNFYDGDGVQQGAQTTTVRVYSPFGDRISVRRATGANTVTVDGLTPGMRVFRVASAGRKLGSPRLVTLQPGANFVTERFYVSTGSGTNAVNGAGE